MVNVEFISDDGLDDLKYIREKVALNIFNIMQRSRKTISEISKETHKCYQSKNVDEVDLVAMLNALSDVDEELQSLEHQIELIELGQAAYR